MQCLKLKTQRRWKKGGDCHLLDPHNNSLLQVAIKVIPRNRVLGWSPLVSTFGVLDLSAPLVIMNSFP